MNLSMFWIAEISWHVAIGKLPVQERCPQQIDDWKYGDWDERAPVFWKKTKNRTRIHFFWILGAYEVRLNCSPWDRILCWSFNCIFWEIWLLRFPPRFESPDSWHTCQQLSLSHSKRDGNKSNHTSQNMQLKLQHNTWFLV